MVRKDSHMPNNADLGMTIQKYICDKYALEPCEKAKRQFESNYNSSLEGNISIVVNRIFAEIGFVPVKCVSFLPSEYARETYNPHNFLLSNGKYLSIRTNKSSSDKVAPRVVGQAGIETFNEHFSDIAGYEIENKNEIKKVVFEKIHEMLPVFIDYMFSSDYTVWIHPAVEDGLEYTIIDKSLTVDIDSARENFTFTKDLNNWNESTTVKYKGVSLAEIQVHTNRTFKFRFIMNALISYIVKQNETTETLGITAEKAICDYFKLNTPAEYVGRYHIALLDELKPVVANAFSKLPKAIKSTGTEKGLRGGTSKCSYDFMLEGNKTLSVKTNTGKMVCPPEVGQPGAETCLYYFSDYANSSVMNSDVFKEMVLEHIEKLMPIYVAHLFDSDYLLWIHKSGDAFDYSVYDSNFARNVLWEKEGFSFTKPSVDLWNESNTVKYRGVSIGEFQVHRNRSCYKFRFNLENFESLIKNNII